MGEDVWAWIAENSDEQDGLYASARFRAHVEVGDDLGEQLDDASLEEALRWARERTDVVLIRLWDSDYFSAGERNPFPDEFPAWPADGVKVVPRRPRGLEALDNTEDDPPVLWDVRSRPGYGVDATAFQNAVEADARTLPVPPEAQSDRIEGVRVLVRVSTQQQAWAIAEELANAGWLAAGPMALPRIDEPVPSRGYEVYPFAPDAPVIFGGGSIRTTPIVIELDE